MVTNKSELEELSAEIHQVYCRYTKEEHGEDHWSNGDYSRLDESWKKAYRYIASFFLTQLTTKDQEITQLKGEVERLEADNRRYQRLRVLGCAPYHSNQLVTGCVMRFQTLDAYLDEDIKLHPSRGEALTNNHKG